MNLTFEQLTNTKIEITIKLEYVYDTDDGERGAILTFNDADIKDNITDTLEEALYDLRYLYVGITGEGSYFDEDEDENVDIEEDIEFKFKRKPYEINIELKTTNDEN